MDTSDQQMIIPCPGFGKIDFILSIAGHKIFADKKWHQIMRIFLIWLCSFRLLSSLIIDVLRYANYEQFTLYHVSDVTFTIFTIVFHICVELKYASIFRFISKYQHLMTREHGDRLKLVSRRFALLFWLFWLTTNIVQTCYDGSYGACDWKAQHVLMHSGNFSLLDAIIMQAAYAYESIVFPGWMAMSFCLYGFCLTMKQEVVSCKLNHLSTIILRSDRVSQSSRRLESSILSVIEEAQDEFDSCFSIFPLLDFCCKLPADIRLPVVHAECAG